MRVAATIFVTAMLMTAPAVRAVDRVWTGGSGNWTDGSHCSPAGQPLAGDRVFVTAVDAINKTITYDYNGPLRVFNSVLVDESGPGSVTLVQPGNQLNAFGLTVGLAGPARYDVTGGTAGFIGATVNAGGDLRVAGSAFFTCGSFIQNGGAVLLGSASDFNALDYVQSGGTLRLADAVSYEGTNFTQGGTSVTAIGRTIFLTGAYAFNAGNFESVSMSTGEVSGGVSCATFDFNNPSGTFGGSVNATQRLNLNVASALIAGNYVGRGPLDVAAGQRLAIGRDVTQIGGAVTQAGTFTTPGGGIIGVTPRTVRLGGGATWLQTGGLNAGGELIVGAGFNGPATYTLNDGTVSYTGAGVFVGELSNGTFVHNGGAVTGTQLVIGGTATAAFGAQHGTYLMNSGQLTGGTNFAITIGTENSAGGAFTQHDGVVGCRTLVINENATNHGRLTITGGSFNVSGRTISHGTFNQSGGTSRFEGNFDGAGVVSVTGNATMDLLRLRQNALSVGGTARVGLAGSLALPPTHRVLSLAFEDGPGGAVRGTWDLGTSDLVIDYTGASPLGDVRRYLASGYAGGSWNGTGLNSSRAVAQDRALGFAEASDVLGPAGGTFSLVFVDATSVLVRYTRYGDANLDGLVNLADFNRLASNFGGSGKIWSQGDFTYDGLVNLADFNRLAANFGLIAAGPEVTPQDWANLVALVPEPACAAAGVMLVALAGRRGSARLRR